VLVAEGDYYPGFQQVGTLPSQPEGLTFLVPRGVEVIGAFPKTGNPTSPDPLLARKTILHGDFLSGGVATRANNVVVCDPGSLPTSPGQTFLQDVTRLKYFVITLGRANGIPSVDGGGLFANPQQGEPKLNVRLENVVFTNNVAAGSGGAVFYSGDSTPVWLGVDQCFFVDNLAVLSGGGVWFGGLGSWATDDFTGASWIYDSVFRGNFAGTGETTPVFATQGGGAIYMGEFDNFPHIANNLIVGNSVRGWGSAIWCHPPRASGGATISCNTITQNQVLLGPDGTTATPGGAVVLDAPTLQGGCFYHLNNDILWKDNGPGSIAEILGTSPSIVVSYSDVGFWPTSQSYPGTGNLNLDPEFIDYVGGNFDLDVLKSPCIDAAPPLNLPDDLPTFGGNGSGAVPAINYDIRKLPGTWPRVFDVPGVNHGAGLTTDMGCFEPH